MRTMRTAFIATAVAVATAGGSLALASASASPSGAAVPAAAASDNAQPASALARRGLQWWFRSLDQNQRDCLAKAALTRPVGPLGAAERQAVRDQLLAAAKACDISVPSVPDGAGPGHPRARIWATLTDEQRACLKDAELTRPLGRLTDEQRQQLRQKVEEAAKACGVTLPTRPSAGAGSTT